MKIFLKKIICSLTFFIFFLPFVEGKPVVQVLEVKGPVFLILPSGQTTTLKKNSFLSEKSEILVGEDGTLTFNDYYNTTYHALGGSHLKFFDQSLQLKKGKIWVDSESKNRSLSITTANGQVNFNEAEYILSFDQVTGRTQVLVVDNEIVLSHILDQSTRQTISEGYFSFLSPDVDSGLPRRPTRVGKKSLDNALAEFNKLPQVLLQDGSPKRLPASVQADRIKTSILKDESHPNGSKMVLSENGPSLQKVAHSKDQQSQKCPCPPQLNVYRKNKITVLRPHKWAGSSKMKLSEKSKILQKNQPQMITSRRPASVDDKLSEKYLSKIFSHGKVKNKKPKNHHYSKVSVHIYGTSWLKSKSSVKKHIKKRTQNKKAILTVYENKNVRQKKPLEKLQRNPASVRIYNPTPKPSVGRSLSSINEDQDFVESFNKEFQKQTKDTDELQNLINDLKSFSH